MIQLVSNQADQIVIPPPDVIRRELAECRQRGRVLE